MPRTCVESLCDHTRPSTVKGTRRLIDLHNTTYGLFHKVNAIIINNKLYITIIIIIIQAVMVVAAITRIQCTRIYRRYQKFWECYYFLGFSERGVPHLCIEIARRRIAKTTTSAGRVCGDTIIPENYVANSL